jgi:hypothetical protein
VTRVPCPVCGGSVLAGSAYHSAGGCVDALKARVRDLERQIAAMEAGDDAATTTPTLDPPAV